jgi:hypothetical protein
MPKLHIFSSYFSEQGFVQRCTSFSNIFRKVLG